MEETNGSFGDLVKKWMENIKMTGVLLWFIAVPGIWILVIIAVVKWAFIMVFKNYGN